MKRSIVWSCLLVLIVSSIGASAATLTPGPKFKFRKNVSNGLEKSVLKETFSQSRTGVKPSSVPAYLGIGNKAYVNAIAMPKGANYFDASYLAKARQLADRASQVELKLSDPEIGRILANEWLHGPGQNLGVGGMYYTDQAKLARDLHDFYKGIEQDSPAASEESVKFYTLPIDKILYKPADGDMQIISSKEYVVIYDPVTKSGELVKKSSVQAKNFAGKKAQATMPQMQEEIPADLSFGGIAHAATPEELYQLKREENFANLTGDNEAAELVWEKGNFPRSFSSQNELGAQLHRFYKGSAVKVQDVFSRQVSYVYEIPVEGLEYAGEGGALYNLAPESYVVLYNEKIGGQVVVRAFLENQRMFKFVK